MPQPWQPPLMRSITTLSCTSMSSTRPPCRATIGFTCWSNRSATRSYRASSAPDAAGVAAFGASAGPPPERAARIACPTDFPTAVQGAGLPFTTVTRLPETTTSRTPAPGIAKIAPASGEPLASSGDVNRRAPPGCTGALTTNLQRASSIGSAVILISAVVMGEVWAARRRRSTGRHAVPHPPRRGDEVLERRQRLLPAAGLEAAVRVHPDLAVGQHPAHRAEQALDLLRRRHPRRVDVVDPGSDLVGILVLAERLEQLGAGARVLDRDHVRIHPLDHADDVVELAVTHVGVDLRAVRDSGGGEPKGVHRPVEVRRPVGAPQRQPLAQGGLVDLDDPNPGALEVGHFVADRERELLRRLGARLIVAHERPLQDRDRAGEHPLHRLLRLRLGEAAPSHGHRPRPRHVAEDDRRLDVTRAVRLYPPVLRERAPPPPPRAAGPPGRECGATRAGRRSRPRCRRAPPAPARPRARRARRASGRPPPPASASRTRASP